MLGTWGYGESVLLSLEEAGFVERYRDRCSPATRRKCLFNRLIDKGIEYLELLDSAQKLLERGGVLGR